MFCFYLEMCWMSEFSVTVRTGEPGLVGVGHQVVVEAVLACERSPAQTALKWSQPSMAPGSGLYVKMILLQLNIN